MDFQKILDYLAEDWDKFRDRAERFREETIDIFLDQFDTFKKLDNRIKVAIGGGILLVVLIILIIVFMPEPIPVIAKLDTSGVLGRNFIALENESEEPIQNVAFVLDDMYIYRMDEMTPLQEITLFMKDFHYMVGDMEEGPNLEDENYVPYTLKVICPLGEKEIELTKKQGWF